MLHNLVRGFSHFRRMNLLDQIFRHPGCSLVEIAAIARFSIPNTEEHIRRLFLAGLIIKARKGNAVLHRTTPSGEHVLGFLRNWEQKFGKTLRGKAILKR